MIIINSKNIALTDVTLSSITLEFYNQLVLILNEESAKKTDAQKKSVNKKKYNFVDRLIFKCEYLALKRKCNKISKIVDWASNLNDISYQFFPFSTNELKVINELLSLLLPSEAIEVAKSINNAFSSNKNSKKNELELLIKKIKKSLGKTKVGRRFYRSERLSGCFTFDEGINKISNKASSSSMFSSPINITSIKHSQTSEDEEFIKSFEQMFRAGNFKFGKKNNKESIENLGRAKRLAVLYGDIVGKIDSLLQILNLHKDFNFQSAINLLNRLRKKYNSWLVNLNIMLGLDSRQKMIESMSQQQRADYDALVSLATKYAKMILVNDISGASADYIQQIKSYELKLSSSLFEAAYYEGFFNAYESCRNFSVDSGKKIFN